MPPAAEAQTETVYSQHGMSFYTAVQRPFKGNIPMQEIDTENGLDTTISAEELGNKQRPLCIED